jgi:hypothetical protein
MKNKILFRAILVGLLAILGIASTYAQSTTPRWGTNSTTNLDNTGRVLNYRYQAVTDGTGADTAKLQPRAFTTIVQCNSVVDSIAFSATTTNAYVGDRLIFMATNTAGSGHQLKFVGTTWQFGSGGAAAALTASKRANLEFVFDGVSWVECQRLVQ